mmetsp:Transcript_11528/g.44696  ORF Transcript_11528/g.44696 Transcript_11528/m.44696 type:complete len:314 (+) Transcript_11528:2905-3846(+)
MSNSLSAAMRAATTPAPRVEAAPSGDGPCPPALAACPERSGAPASGEVTSTEPKSGRAPASRTPACLVEEAPAAVLSVAPVAGRLDGEQWAAAGAELASAMAPSTAHTPGGVALTGRAAPALAWLRGPRSPADDAIEPRPPTVPEAEPLLRRTSDATAASLPTPLRDMEDTPTTTPVAPATRAVARDASWWLEALAPEGTRGMGRPAESDAPPRPRSPLAPSPSSDSTEKSPMRRSRRLCCSLSGVSQTELELSNPLAAVIPDRTRPLRSSSPSSPSSSSARARPLSELSSRAEGLRTLVPALVAPSDMALEP